ncbi:hypothetical protein KCP77_18865 [Salmonella enterica subsp. enterica]|nr:hypothetical protein KCP77_18865 [Salmonella enterica subsp. enterica]
MAASFIDLKILLYPHSGTSIALLNMKAETCSGCLLQPGRAKSIIGST